MLNTAAAVVALWPEKGIHVPVVTTLRESGKLLKQSKELKRRWSAAVFHLSETFVVKVPQWEFIILAGWALLSDLKDY